MKTTPFPFRNTGSRLLDLKPIQSEDKSNDANISKFSWLSDGAVRPTEEGLPIYIADPSSFDPSKHNPMQSLIHLIEDKPFLKEFNRDYGELASRHPEYDLNDPDMMSHYEKQLVTEYYSKLQEQQALQPDPDGKIQNPKSKSQDLRLKIHDHGRTVVTSKIPVDAHLSTWGNALPYYETDLFDVDDPNAMNKKVVKRKMRTGIYGEQKLHEQDGSALIREIHFKSLEHEQPDLALAKDPATSPLVFHAGDSRLSATITKLPGGASDPTVQDCIKKFFDPEVGIPFVPSDVCKYFPVGLLLPDSNQGQKLSHTFDANSRYSQHLVLPDTPSEEMDPKSTLLDTSGEDVLFTKNKAPFSRNDIATLRQFNNHWDSLKLQQREKSQLALKKRQSMIKQAFHSKEIFDNYLKLLNEDCHRIQSGVLGKSKYKRKSLWQVAIETAPTDHSGLLERREFWYRFCEFVRFNGGMKDQLDKDFVKLLRIKLMLRHPINSSLFWDVLHSIDVASFEHVATLRLIEYFRFALNVGQQEFTQFLDSLNISHMIYDQTVINTMSREYLDEMNSIAHKAIKVPYMD